VEQFEDEFAADPNIHHVRTYKQVVRNASPVHAGADSQTPSPLRMLKKQVTPEEDPTSHAEIPRKTVLGLRGAGRKPLGRRRSLGTVRCRAG
jgi:hypothetical protein